MSDVTVRRLREADHDPWVELWRGYLSFYRAELPDPVTALTFERLCGERDGMLGLVAADADGVLLGLAHLVVHASSWSAASAGYLNDLFVEPARRGAGAARALIEAAYAAAAERGCDRVYWHTQQFNGPARSLYDTVAGLTSFAVYEHALTPIAPPR